MLEAITVLVVTLFLVPHSYNVVDNKLVARQNVSAPPSTIKPVKGTNAVALQQ